MLHGTPLPHSPQCTLFAPPKNSHKQCFLFLLGNCNTQKKWKTKVMQNFGGQIRCIMGNVEMEHKPTLSLPNFTSKNLPDSRISGNSYIPKYFKWGMCEIYGVSFLLKLTLSVVIKFYPLLISNPGFGLLNTKWNLSSFGNVSNGFIMFTRSHGNTAALGKI